MAEVDVRIERRPAMRVAAYRSVGEKPERDAWEALLAWARAKGVLEGAYRIFGHNTLSPVAGRHGDEFWITVGPVVGGEGDVRVLDYAGGVTRSLVCGDWSRSARAGRA